MLRPMLTIKIKCRSLLLKNVIHGITLGMLCIAQAARTVDVTRGNSMIISVSYGALYWGLESGPGIGA